MKIKRERVFLCSKAIHNQGFLCQLFLTASLHIFSMVSFEFPYLTSVSRTPKVLATRSGLSLALMQWCAMLTTLCTTALSWTTENHRPPPLDTPSNRVKMLLKRPSSRMGTCKKQDQIHSNMLIHFFLDPPIIYEKASLSLVSSPWVFGDL